MSIKVDNCHRVCHACGVATLSDAPTVTCSECCVAIYCNAECQGADLGHKSECLALQKSIAKDWCARAREACICLTTHDTKPKLTRPHRACAAHL